ncbi:MAG TPA: nicotinamide riboside transporter PnuC [Flavipsychrobacter sp.]|nr:nicotinamide riboside transporter PnuC [Flavipsychrobacter sp.]
MNMQQFAGQLAVQLSNTSVFEWIAVIFGVLQVLLAWKNKVLLYPAGIISTAFSIYLLAHVHLYAESFLNLYYLVMSVYGCAHWLRKRSESQLPITKATTRDWTITAAIVFIGLILLYLILKNFTPSDVPFWDAWVSATAWAGMWLLAKRKLENWILLNVSNAFAIPLQFHKDIPLYAMLTIVLFIVAIFGYLEWRKILQQQQSS